MSAIIALVILTGAACSSPTEQALRETVAYQVQCAIVIREQSANPFKLAQMPNTVTPAAAPAAAPATPDLKAGPKYKYPKKKKTKHKKRKARK